MMKFIVKRTKDEAVCEIEELKEWHCDLTDAKNTYKYEETTKKVGEYVRRIYGEAMRALVVSDKETVIAKPDCPTGDSVTEEKKAIWGKECNLCVKKNAKYEQDKAKAYEVVWSCCTKAMKNRIEKLGNYEAIEETNNIIKLTKAITRQAFDANEKKHPSLWMTLAWKKLCMCHQCDDEDLINHHRRFVGVIEMVELSYGNLKPKDVIKRKEVNMFMEGVDKKWYGYLLKNLETDYSLGSKEAYPEGIEDSSQVLIMHSEKKLKKKVIKAGEDAQLGSFAQAGKCWECRSDQHYKKDCTKWKNEQANNQMIKSLLQNHVTVDPDEGPAWMSSIE